MTKKIDDKKIGSVTGTTKTDKVFGADTVGSVEKVEKATSIGQVSSVNSVKTKRSGTREMSAQERAELFSMIQQESEKLFKDMPEEKRKVLGDAVKMAIDTGIIEE